MRPPTAPVRPSRLLVQRHSTRQRRPRPRTGQPAQSDRRPGSSFRYKPGQPPTERRAKESSAADYFLRFVQKAKCRFPCSLASGFLKQTEVAEGTLHATAPRLRQQLNISNNNSRDERDGRSLRCIFSRTISSRTISDVPKQISPFCPEAAGGADGPPPSGSHRK